MEVHGRFGGSKINSGHSPLLFSLLLLLVTSGLLSIYGSTAICWTLAAFQFLNLLTKSIALLGLGIILSQGRYLHPEQLKHRINAHRHPCLEWDSNSPSQCLSGRSRSCLSLDRAATVIGTLGSYPGLYLTKSSKRGSFSCLLA
jgi:hypothetical protein